LSNLARTIRSGGITVSSIGVGVDFNEDVMQRIAELGSGSYGFMRDASKLASIFQKDLQQAGTTVARNVELSFELPPNTTLSEVMGYSHTQAGRTVRVTLPDFSAGQLETIVARVQLSAPSTGSMDVTALKLNYTDLLKGSAISASASLATMVTEKREEMYANADKKVILMGARAQSAMNVQKAADAMKQGDFGGAQGLLQKNEAIYDEAEEFTGAGTATVDRDQNAQYLDTVNTAPTAAPEEQNYRAKAMKVDAFKQAGRGASIY
jgi:Ca-activated chloride channel family protein